MKRVMCLVFVLCFAIVKPSPGQNLAPNGDFEAKDFGWTGAGVTLDKVMVHGGTGALRLDADADRPAGSAKPMEKIVLNQESADPLMAAVWLRVNVKKPLGKVRAGMSIRLEFVDGTALYWYSPFEVSEEEMSDVWGYREGRYRPRSPVASATIGIYLKNIEGSIRADDIYLGPPAGLPAPPVGTLPVSVTGDRGRFNGWATFQVKTFQPAAHVFHLAGENRANLSVQCVYDVTRPAPIYLNSAWGSQYWTLYQLDRRELCQIYTDERLDLSKPGENHAELKMNNWCDDANPLTKGGYLFITDYMRQIASAVRAAKPGIQFGGYVWTRIAPDKDRCGQDFPRWLKEGTFDFVFMGNYRSSLPFFRAVCHVCRQIVEAHGLQPHQIIPMPGIAYIDQSYRHHETNAAMLSRELEIISEEGFSDAGLFSFSPARVYLDTLKERSADEGSTLDN